jgi:hypothetical protein
MDGKPDWQEMKLHHSEVMTLHTQDRS